MILENNDMLNMVPVCHDVSSKFYNLAGTEKE